MSLNAPCLNCIDRDKYCHSNCKLYDNYKKENDKRKEKIKQSNQIDKEWYGLKKEKYKRINKRR